ncbi:MAG: hypothetical protein U1E10_17580 [Bdellovibrionales bacterium]|nr:hypothetical protein [Bdellovibrionales bacterium]
MGGKEGAEHALKAHKLLFDLCFNDRFERACDDVTLDVHFIRDPKVLANFLQMHLIKFKEACEEQEPFYCRGLASTYSSLNKPELSFKTFLSNCEKDPAEGCLAVAWELHKKGNVAEAHRYLLRGCEAAIWPCAMGLLHFSNSPDVKRFEERVKTDCLSSEKLSLCDILGTFQLADGRVSEARSSFLAGCRVNYQACLSAAALDFRSLKSTSGVALLKSSCSEKGSIEIPDEDENKILFGALCKEVQGSSNISANSLSRLIQRLDSNVRAQKRHAAQPSTVAEK